MAFTTEHHHDRSKIGLIAHDQSNEGMGGRLPDSARQTKSKVTDAQTLISIFHTILGVAAKINMSS